MPPEPLPWDRKDFLKERKHERSVSDSVGPRWRDPQHHGSSRWASFDFRRPPGHGKQGGRHLFSEESGHGFTPSRSSEKTPEDENCRLVGSRWDGKYSRYGKDNRGSFSQKEWRGQSWENTVSPNGPSNRLSDMNDQRPGEDLPPYSTHHPNSDVLNTWDQHNLKDQNEKNGELGGSGAGPRLERESMGLIDWKPRKWTRSGSLSSRGSGFSHSNSSKSMGVDSTEAKAEMPLRNVTPVQSPSGDFPACVTSAPLSEETSSRKKPRLGWGEGLAKYEKKKVEGPDDGGHQNGMIIVGSNAEAMQHNAPNLVDKSPRFSGFSDCASPATPSSVACSSSPGMEEKQFVKAANVDNDNLCGSPALISQNHSLGFTLDLENLDSSSANLCSAISELIQCYDPSSVDSAFMRFSANNKLLVWKSELLKALEMTESEIDSLENELKLLPSEPLGSRHYPAASSSLPLVSLAKPVDELGGPCNSIPRPAPLQLVSSGDMLTDRERNPQEDEHAKYKDEDTDSPGTATSKFVEPGSLRKVVHPSDCECFENLDVGRSEKIEVSCSVTEKTADASTCGEGSEMILSNRCAPVLTDSSSHSALQDSVYDAIVSSSKSSAKMAAEVLHKLLPDNQCHVDFSKVCSSSYFENAELIKERFVKRKRFMRFKESVLTLKFRAFQHCWKQDMHLLSMRKNRLKSHKKSDTSLRTVNSLHQKNRSSIRIRFSSPAGNSSPVTTTELINYTNKLLLNPQLKLCRNSLKMPALILGKEEKTNSRFISINGLVEDPWVVEKERSLINPWTSEEKEIFIDKLATFGKDFKKISSFLHHKSIADCVEFYYKNHKSDSFERAKKKSEFPKQEKSYSTSTYLVTSGKRWSREANAASLDMLGAATEIAANVHERMEIQQNRPSRYYRATPRSDDFSDERETEAADVLAGICGSISSEAMSSCIMSSVDHGEGYEERNSQKMGSSMGMVMPLTPDDETCSGESCAEIDPGAWTDEEKSAFIRAISLYGKDFALISRCVRTRSRDQCKVFFSKAKKCLGLDTIVPGIENGGRPRSENGNGGGSDNGGTCAVETGSGVCSDGSGFKADEGSDSKVKHDESKLAETSNLHPDLNESDENTNIGSANLYPDSCEEVEGKLDPQSDGENNSDVVTDGGVVVEVHESAVTASEGGQDGQCSSETSVSAVEGNDDIALPTGLGLVETENQSVDVVNVECSVAAEEERGKEPILQFSSAHGERIGNNGLDPMPQSVDTCMHGSEPLPQSVDASQSLQYVVPHELESAQDSKPSLLQQENGVAEVFIQHEKVIDETLPTIDLGKMGNLEDNSQRLFECSVSDHVDSSLRTNGGDIGCRRTVSLQSAASKLDMGFHSYLQKCNGSKHHNPVVELPFLSQEQSKPASTDVVDKPCRNGDIKLFGQILTDPSSQPKPNSNSNSNSNSNPGTDGNDVGKSFELKFNHGIDGNSAAQPKFDRNSYLGSLENLSTRSYGFWDGNRIQTGFSALPDSTILLAKYPAAFANYTTPSSKVEQLNSVSVFPTREIGSGGKGVVADYQYVKPPQQQRQDTIFSGGGGGGGERRNGFEAVASVQQQQSRGGLVGINVVGRGGIMVGGSCNGVSDPVAAIRMHYAKTEQYGGQKGNEGTWRGKGDISR